MHCDTLIIGGGVMGCGVALRLAQAGQKVTVLERSIPGAEASSAAAGILAPQAECDAPGPMLDLGLRSRSLYPAFAEELREATDLDIGYRRCGVLKVASTEEGAQRLAARATWQRAAGLSATPVSTTEVRELEPALTGPMLSGLHLPEEGQVEAPMLATALSLAAARAGVVFETEVVRSVWVEGGRARGVELESGRRESQAVVVAAGAWSALVPGSGPGAASVRPARGQIAQLEMRPLPLSRVIFTERGYLVPRRDGRLLVGSTLEFVGFEKRVTAGGVHSLLDLAIEAVPRLADAALTSTWCGFRPHTPDGLPLLGPCSVEGLFFASGHHRNGILLAPVTAEVVSAAVLKRSGPVPLGPFRPERWPSQGPVGLA